MPWASESVREQFQTTIFHLEQFHKVCTKRDAKYQPEFNKIGEACESTLDFLFDEEMTKGAEQILSSAMTGIFTQFIQIAYKKVGGEFNLEFLIQAITALWNLCAFREACKIEIKMQTAAQKGVNDSSTNANNVNAINTYRAAPSIIKTKEELLEEINLIKTAPFIDPTCGEAVIRTVNRSARYNPVLSTATVGIAVVGLTLVMANLVEKIAGEKLNEWMHADKSHLNWQDVMGLFLLMAAATVGVGLIIKNHPRSTAKLFDHTNLPEADINCEVSEKQQQTQPLLTLSRSGSRNSNV